MAYEYLDTPTDTETFRAFADEIRKHHIENHDELRERAAELKKGLREYLVHSLGVGKAEAYLIVARITRPIIKAARLNLTVGKFGRRSYNEYLRLVVERPKVQVRNRGFKP